MKASSGEIHQTKVAYLTELSYLSVMSRMLLFIAFYFWSSYFVGSSLFGQNLPWKTLPIPNDSAYAELHRLEQRAFRVTQHSPDSVYWYLEQLRMNMHRYKLPSVDCEIFQRMGWLKGQEGKHLEAIDLLLKAHGDSSNTPNPLCLCECERNLAELYLKENQKAEALDWLDRVMSEPFCREVLPEKVQDSLFQQLGVLYTQQAEPIEPIPPAPAPPSNPYGLYALLTGLVVAIIALFFFVRQKQSRWSEGMSQLEEKLKTALSRQQELEMNLEQKRKQLTSLSLNLAQRNQMITEFKAQLGSLAASSTHEAHPLIHQMKRQVEQHLNIDQNWEEFNTQFQAIHQDFLSGLSKEYPKLTPGDLRVCALLKLNLSTNEIASLLGIAPQSVRITTYRIRKKMGLPKGTKLSEFILKR